MTATTSGSRMALTIDTQDEGVRIAAAALKDMREGNPPADPTSTVMASFATSRHERSHPSHSPTRRKHLLVPFSFYLFTAQSEFLPFFITSSLAARHAIPALYCIICDFKLL